MENSARSASSSKALKRGAAFSIRTRILAAYGVLVCLFFLILVTGFTQFKGIAARLNAVQRVYFPLGTRIAGFGALYHLDPGFGYASIEKNWQNPLFVNAVATLNPRLFEQGLRRSMDDTARSLVQEAHFDKNARLALRRLGEISERLLAHHREYAALIATTVDLLRRGDRAGAAALDDELAEKKRDVRSHLDLLSNRIGDLTKRNIQEVVESERRGVYAIAALSLVTFLLALVIGLTAIRALRPLDQLKRTAREIAAGNLSIRADVRARDEVGDLAREFNTMADAIEARDGAIRRQQDRLLESEKMAVIGQMAAKISHEVRNPLNALSLNVERLGETIGGGAGRELVPAVAREIDRLNRVTMKYLDMARAPKGAAQRVDLGDALAHIHELLKPECAKAGVTMKLEASPDLPALDLDATGLEQALLNLSRNALEASPAGSAFGIRAARGARNVAVEVWDEGPGIAVDDAARVFEPFYTTKAKGTGLGLAITREIVNDLGGSLSLESRPGAGARFTLTLPIA